MHDTRRKDRHTEGVGATAGVKPEGVVGDRTVVGAVGLAGPGEE